MKKKFVLVLALVMICSTMLTACAISGTTWKLTKLESDMGDFDEDQIESTGMSINFEFKDDGTVVSDVFDGVAEWEQTGYIVSITSEGETVDCKIIVNKLVIEYDDTKMIFTKQ